MIKGAIFDIDGTLLDSMPIWDEVGIRYIRQQGKIPKPDLKEHLAIMSMEEGVAYLKKQYDIDKTEAQIRQEILKIIEDFYLYEVSLKPGVEEFLENLKTHGIAMVLATGGDKHLAMAALSRLGVAEYFGDIFTCTELHTTKREPLIYQTAVSFLGCKPDEALVFEDVLHALCTAADSGFCTVSAADAASKDDREKIKKVSRYYMEDYSDFDAFWEFLSKQ